MKLLQENRFFIENNGRRTAVIISAEEYQKFVALDDMYWGALAMPAKPEGVYQGDAMQRILDIAQKKHQSRCEPVFHPHGMG